MLRWVGPARTCAPRLFGSAQRVRPRLAPSAGCGAREATVALATRGAWQWPSGTRHRRL